MTTSSLIHDIPNSPVQRVMLTLMGSFVLFMVPYELGRGIWPLNTITPLFAALVALGMGLGATIVYGGLFSPSVEYELSETGIIIKLQFLRGNSELFHPISKITDVTIITENTSDGPDNWYAVINITGQKPLLSRPFGSEATAQNYARQFRTALGLVS